MPAIVVENLAKSYGSVHAVDGISFEVHPGEVFALLGPNGAGKTTTVEVLEGYKRADAGAVDVLGFDPATAGPDFRDRIGIVLQSSGVERELTVRELLEQFATYYSNPRPPGEVMDLIGLTEKADARIKTLSGGQRRRLDLAAGIVGNPSLLFLDEPTTGFDPSARRNAWHLIEDLKRLGTTILLTTHYLDEAQHLADRVAVVSQGKIVAEGDPDTLGGRDTAEAVISFRLPETASPSDLPAAAGPAEIDGRTVRISSPRPTGVVHALAGWALDRGQELEALQVLRPTLEDVYLGLVGGEGADR